jgi:hypothetical protein
LGVLGYCSISIQIGAENACAEAFIAEGAWLMRGCIQFSLFWVDFGATKLEVENLETFGFLPLAGKMG